MLLLLLSPQQFNRLHCGACEARLTMQPLEFRYSQISPEDSGYSAEPLYAVMFKLAST
jgi:hypothetical protein